MNKIKFTFLTILAFLSINCFALGPVYLDLYTSAGYGKAAVSTEAASPNMLQYGIGTTIGWNFSLFYAGVSANYYIANQLTTPDNTFGNRKGKRTNLASPTLGMHLGGVHLKFDYQFMGKYTLDKTTTSGETVAYETPAGMRAYLGYKYSPMLELGLFYETVSYGKEVSGSTTTTLTNKLKISQIGVVWGIVF